MRLIALLIAVAGPFLLNEAVSPNALYPNEILAVFGWGLLLCAAPAPRPGAGALRDLRPLLLALALLCVGCVLSMATGGVPSSPGLAILVMQLMAAALAWHGASIATVEPEALFRPFAIALVVAGVCGALVGIVQIFAAVYADNHFIAAPADQMYPGRAVGNLGQPNHFADTQVWALAALVALLPPDSARDLRARILRVGMHVIGVLLLLGVILSSSRMGMVGIAMLGAWGAFDRTLPKNTRIALVAAVAVAVLLWCGVDLWSHGDAKLADLGKRPGFDVSSSRFQVWSHALTMIAQQPLFGVGWGQYGFASVMTAMPDRTPGFDENTHSLPLQLAAELGVPMALVLLALLTGALWLSIRNVRRLAGRSAIVGRCVLVMILYMGVHSLLEYPLWYTYFLFPTAWLWGLTLGWPATPASLKSAPVAARAPSPRSSAMSSERAWRVGGLLMAASGAVAWLSYLTVVEAYRFDSRGAPLAERIARAEESPLFRNYADRMVALQAQSPVEVMPYIERAVRANPNGGVIFVWMNALESNGEHDKARYVAARLREFKLNGPAPFFAPCDDPAVTDKPFQCLPPARSMTWRDLLR